MNVSPVEIRPFAEGDLEALYRICLQTGDAGRDATGLYANPLLLGAFYAAPYAVKDPTLCLMACVDGVPCGYVLGTDDSLVFRNWSEANWFPRLRGQWPAPEAEDVGPDAKLLRLIHDGYRPHPDLAAYPGHLHIDLLPCLQGRGVGKRLILAFADLLRQRGCPALHLGVGEANQGACAFYQKVGFRLLGRYPGWRAYGMALEK